MSVVSEPTIPTGQVETEFLFLADALALDLVNTEIAVRGKPYDLLVTPTDLANWWQAALQQHPDHDRVQSTSLGTLCFDEDLLVASKVLRRALRYLFSALAEQQVPANSDLDMLNAALGLGQHILELTGEGSLLSMYRTTDPLSGPLLFPIALSALSLVRDGEQARLHKCSNERCVLLFYDATKSATRRWCSTGCFERARSRQRYKQSKAQLH